MGHLDEFLKYQCLKGWYGTHLKHLGWWFGHNNWKTNELNLKVYTIVFRRQDGCSWSNFDLESHSHTSWRSVDLRYGYGNSTEAYLEVMEHHRTPFLELLWRSFPLWRVNVTILEDHFALFVRYLEDLHMLGALGGQDGSLGRHSPFFGEDLSLERTSYSSYMWLDHIYFYCCFRIS